jgi:Coenzyme PQQ synthesis protein D (PqqD)
MYTVASGVRFVRNREVVTRQIDGELIIVPIRRGVGNLNSLYTLNLVGCVLWEYLNEGRTVPEMVQRVCDEFEVTVAQAQNDIQLFLDSLLEEQLIQSVA